MKFNSRLHICHLLFLSTVLIPRSTDTAPVDITAIDNNTLIVNGSIDLQLNLSYPIIDQNKNAYQHFNLTLKPNAVVSVTNVNDNSTGRRALITYPLTGTTSGSFSMVFDMRIVKELFFIHQVNFSYELDNETFPDLDPDFQNSPFSVSSNVRPKFQTPVGNVFICKTTIPIPLSNDSVLTMTNTQFRAFNNDSDWATATREECPRDYETKPDVRIATGSAFGALIIAAVIAAVVLNCRKSD